MAQDTTQQGTTPSGSDARLRPAPMAMCPMATMCSGMIRKPPSGLLPTLAGAVLIVLGALIAFEPRVLVWVAATLSVLFGIMMLVMASFVRRFGAQLRSM